MSTLAQPVRAQPRRSTYRAGRDEKRRRTPLQTVLLYLLTGALGLMFTGPFLWTLSTSLKTPYEVLQYPPSLFPAVPQFANYVETWKTIDFGTFTKNSLIVTILSTIGTVLSSAIVAYGFSRYRFRGRDFFFMLCLSGMMLPPQVTIIPLFMVFKTIRWIDTLKPLIVPSFLGGGAFSIFLLRQFFLTLPLELDEAATIDGASKLTIFFRIMLPLSGPALSSVAIFSFGSHWNAFLQPLIFLNSKDKFTLPLGLTYLVRQPADPGLPNDHLLMAAAVLTTLPMLVLFFSGQKYFVRGIVTTGIKG